MSLLNDCLTKTVGHWDVYDFLCVYPHSSAPCHNLHSEIDSELNDGDAVHNASVLFKPFPFVPSYPVPVNPPAKISKSVINGFDPCLELIKQKKRWEYSKDILLNSCDNSMIKGIDNADELQKMKHIKAHPNVIKLTEHMKNDPDQHFSGIYNWYYSGSNIEILNVRDNKYLLKPNGFNGEITFSPLILQNNQWTLRSDEYDDIKFNLKYPELPCQVDVTNNLALIRQKSCCCYLKLKYKGERVKVKKLCDIPTTEDNPFVSVSMNKNNNEEFCTLTPQDGLTVWDAHSARPSTRICLNPEDRFSSDSFGLVNYIGPNALLYANRQTVRLIDVRTNFNIENSVSWSVDKLVESCEDISCCSSGTTNVQYVATNHHLLCLDPRRGWTERWTHGITTPPSIMKILHRNYEDFIFLASQRSDNVVFIHNDISGSGISRIHPYSLPSLRESLHMAQCNGLCLDHLISSRFTMSLTGLCCLEDKYVNVIRCTSAGDLFWQKLESSIGNSGNTVKPQMFADDIKQFEEFESNCEEAYNFAGCNYKVTAIRKSKKLIDYLYSPSKVETNELTSEAPPPSFNKMLPRCEQLKSYCDYLAPSLLEAWNVDTLSDDSVESSSPDNGSDAEDASCSEDEYDIEAAVSSWLDTYCSEMTMNTEYKIEDEDLDVEEQEESNLDENFDNLEDGDLEMSEPEQKQLCDLNLSTQPVETALEVIMQTENQIIGSSSTNRCAPKRVSRQKPVPTPKKKFVSGF